MKPRILPIILVLFGAAGITLFLLMPVMTSSAKFIDVPTDTDLKISFDVFYNGTGHLWIKGMDFGVETDIKIKIEADEWDTIFLSVSDADYNPLTMYLSIVGLGVAILGMIFSIFGGNTGLRIIGAILALGGAGCAIAGGFMLWTFNTNFQADADDFFVAMDTSFPTIDMSHRYSTFGIGWLASISSMGLIAISALVLLVVAPKKSRY